MLNRISLPAMLFTILLAGCKSPDRTADSIPSPPLAEQQTGQDIRHLQQCQLQLKALRTLQATGYPEVQRTFDLLMRGAAQYASLRASVNSATQDTVDALYRYRVNLLCAQINQAVLDRLAEQVGMAR